MKILYLLDFPPFEEDFDGITKIYYNLIKHISKDNVVELLIVSKGVNNKYIEYRNKNFDKKDKFYAVKNIYYESIKFTKFDKYINRLKFEYSTSLSLMKINKLNNKYNFNKYDVIHSAHLSFLNICQVHKKVIIGATDASSLAMPSNTLKQRLRKFYFKQIENKISKSSAWIHAVTKRDADGFCTDRKFVITNGVDTEKYKKYEGSKIKNSFVFHGNLDYQPNIDAIFYMNKVISELDLDYKLYIVGRGDSIRYNQLKNVIIIGEVENIAKEICKYEYYFILMQTGTGVKNKLLEAMSCECNIVCNSLAINGLKDVEVLKNNIHLINSNDEIKKIILNSNILNARDYVKENYSWKSFSDKFMDVYKTI
ncbi:glycosyltransferase [Aliarcobacter skirrowii]|uniref:glycosyltransferase n=1 Tax=Aliarcobacter skirrowii TaxID=28200 RepID=UPI000834F07B|nr:glycosyltransferase [Aliarcobacter skirrowii]